MSLAAGQAQSLPIDMPERGVMPFSSAYFAEEAWIIGSTIDLSVAIQSLTSLPLGPAPLQELDRTASLVIGSRRP